MLDEITDILQLGDRIATGGYWSGTENRHHQHYLAVIPESRYSESGPVAPDEPVVVAAEHPPIPAATVDPEWRERVQRARQHFTEWVERVKPPIVDQSLVKLWREEKDMTGRLVYVMGFQARIYDETTSKSKND